MVAVTRSSSLILTILLWSTLINISTLFTETFTWIIAYIELLHFLKNNIVVNTFCWTLKNPL